MTGKIIIMGWAALILTACLDRSYDNPFLSGSDVSEDWKTDRDGNGIADSVEAYAPGCRDLPAECLRQAKAGSVIAQNLANKIGKDTVPAGVVTPAVPPIVTPITINPPLDTVQTPVAPKDTVRDTLIVTTPLITVTGIQSQAIYIPMGVSQVVPSISVLPRDAKNQGYTLQSLDGTIVKVTGTALVPVKPGVATIRALSAEGRFTSDFQATVFLKDTNRYEEKVAVAPMTLVAGDPPLAPQITWTPADVTIRGYTLVSSDSSHVLVVMQNGLPECKALAAGEANLTLKTLGKGLNAIFHVVVNPAPIVIVPVTAIAAANTVLNLGAADQLPAVTYTPSNGTNKHYRLASDQSGIVSVTVTGLHAVSGGTAHITITSVDGPSSVFDVSVRVPVASVSAPDLSLTVGQKTTVIVTVLPANADVRDYTLSSDTPKNVSVQGNEIAAVKNGAAIITITTLDGGKHGTFNVLVSKRGGGG